MRSRFVVDHVGCTATMASTKGEPMTTEPVNLDWMVSVDDHVLEPPNVWLDRLPAMTLWPEDGGPFVTLPLVFTQHPDGRGHNLGMYRLHVHDARTTGMHWQIGKGGGYHYGIAEARGARLPVTV